MEKSKDASLATLGDSPRRRLFPTVLGTRQLPALSKTSRLRSDRRGIESWPRPPSFLCDETYTVGESFCSAVLLSVCVQYLGVWRQATKQFAKDKQRFKCCATMDIGEEIWLVCWYFPTCNLRCVNFESTDTPTVSHPISRTRRVLLGYVCHNVSR